MLPRNVRDIGAGMESKTADNYTKPIFDLTPYLSQLTIDWFHLLLNDDEILS